MALLAFFATIFPSSFGFVERYAGLTSVVAYASGVLVACGVGFFLIVPRLADRLSIRTIQLLLAGTLVTLVLGFFVVYPLADSGRFGGGSDGDDALNVGTRALLALEYPYYERTYLGNPPSPMPGGFLFALPFVLIGNAAFQNILWLLVFVGVIQLTVRDWLVTAVLFAAAIFLSPSLWQSYLTGNDHLPNAVAIMLFAYLVIDAVNRPAPIWRWGFLAAILLGAAFAWRPNFAFLLPLVWAALCQRGGWRRGTLLTSVTAATTLGLVLPFYLYDPAAFYPIQTSDRLEHFNAVLPHASRVILALTATATLLLMFTRNADWPTFCRNASLVLLIPVAASVTLASIANEQPTFQAYAHYARFALPFALVAFGPPLVRLSHRAPVEQRQNLPPTTA